MPGLMSNIEGKEFIESYGKQDGLMLKKNYKGHKAYAWCLPKSLPLLIEKEFTRGDTCVYVEKEIL